MTKRKHPQLYCSHCGAPMELIRERFAYYDMHTGKPVIELKWRCPLRAWYNLLHDKTTSDEKGNLKQYVDF